MNELFWPTLFLKTPARLPHFEKKYPPRVLRGEGIGGDAADDRWRDQLCVLAFSFCLFIPFCNKCLTPFASGPWHLGFIGLCGGDH